MTTISYFTHEFTLKVRLEWTGKWSISAFTNLQSSIVVQDNFDICLIRMVSQLITELNRKRVGHLAVIEHRNWLLRASPWDHQAGLLHGISPISMKLCQFKGSTPKLEKTNWFVFWIFQGGDRPPPLDLSDFYHGNCFKLGKIYEALSTTVFDLLLWGCTHKLIHP